MLCLLITSVANDLHLNPLRFKEIFFKKKNFASTYFFFLQLDLQYAHNRFALNSTIGLTSAPVVELAATVGTSELSFGAEVGFDSTSASVTKYNSGIGYNKSDFSASLLL